MVKKSYKISNRNWLKKKVISYHTEIGLKKRKYKEGLNLLI